MQSQSILKYHGSLITRAFIGLVRYNMNEKGYGREHIDKYAAYQK